MKKRTGFLFLALGALSFLVSGINGKENIPSYKDENTTYLLTIDNSLCGNDEAVKTSQDSVLARLRSTLGFKYSVVNQFTQASNIIEITFFIFLSSHYIFYLIISPFQCENNIILTAFSSSEKFAPSFRQQTKPKR